MLMMLADLMMTTAPGADDPAAGTAAYATPQVVNLIGGPVTPVASAWPAFWMALIVAGLVVIFAGLMAYAWSRLELPERAFRVLAFRLGLRRSERRMTRDLAGSLEVPPVALLLSARAFAQALERAVKAGLGVDARAADRLRTRVFG